MSRLQTLATLTHRVNQGTLLSYEGCLLNFVSHLPLAKQLADWCDTKETFKAGRKLLIPLSFIITYAGTLSLNLVIENSSLSRNFQPIGHKQATWCVGLCCCPCGSAF